VIGAISRHNTVRRAWLIGSSPKPMAFCVMLSAHDSILGVDRVNPSADLLTNR